MRKYFLTSVLTLASVALVLLPLPVKAQSSDLSTGIRLNTATVSPGGTVGVFAWVQNMTSGKMRVSVQFTSLAACGNEVMLGSNRIALSGGQGVQVTVSYPIAPDACPGTYAITFHAKSGGKNAAETSTTCYLTVL